MNISTEGYETDTLIVIVNYPTGYCLGSVTFLLVFKKKSVLYNGSFRLQFGHKGINHLFDHLKEFAAHFIKFPSIQCFAK